MNNIIISVYRLILLEKVKVKKEFTENNKMVSVGLIDKIIGHKHYINNSSAPYNEVVGFLHKHLNE